MKFQCPSCKASYQLPDQRVAGKILQIKCRRCASMIEVVGDPALTAPPGSKPGGFSSSVAPPPTASGLPTAAADGPDDDEETAIMKVPPRYLVPGRAAASKPAAGSTPPPSTAASAGRAPLSGLGRMTLGAPAARSGPAEPPRPGAAPVPRSSPVGTAKGAPAAGVERAVATADPAAPVADATLPSPGADKLALFAASAAAAPSKPAPAIGGAPASKPLFPSVSAPGATGRVASPAKPGANLLGARGGKTLLGLAAPLAAPAAASAPGAAPAAPAAAVGSAPPAGPVAEPSKVVRDQWFVEIAGSRLGPFDRDAIRQKVLDGTVTGDSLLWREASAGSQHLKSMPEFAEWLREAQSRRVPLNEGTRPRASSPPAAAVAMFAPAASASAAATHGQAAGAPSSPAQAPLEVMADPFATPVQVAAPAAGAVPAPAAPAALPGGEAKTNGALAAVGVRLPVEPPPASMAEPLSRAVRKRAGMPFMAYVFIALAAGFGGVGAYVLLTRQPPATGPQIVYVSAAVPAGTAPAVAGPVEAVQAPGATAAADTTDSSPKAATKPGPSRPSDPKAAASSAPLDMSGFANTGVAGPTAEGASGTSAQASGGKLSEGEMNGVVAQNKPLVYRRCWQPALDSRSGTGATSARVVASLVIGPAGNVQQVSASGAEKEFPGLANCIAGRVKAWKFPASGGTTQVNVPFVFASQ